MGAKQSKRSVDISGKEAEGGGEVAVAGAGGEGRLEALAEPDALKPQLNGDAHIQPPDDLTEKEKQLDSGTPENEKDATTEKENKDEVIENKEKEAVPATNGEAEIKAENATVAAEDVKKPKKEKVKKKWSFRSISFSKKEKPKQEKKQKDEEPKTNGETEKLQEEVAEAIPEIVNNKSIEEDKEEKESESEKVAETSVSSPLSNGTTSPEPVGTPATEPVGTPATEPVGTPASELATSPDSLPIGDLAIADIADPAPVPTASVDEKQNPAPEIPTEPEVCVDQTPPVDPSPPPLPANPPPSSVASFATTTMAPELVHQSPALSTIKTNDATQLSTITADEITSEKDSNVILPLGSEKLELPAESETPKLSLNDSNQVDIENDIPAKTFSETKASEEPLVSSAKESLETTENEAKVSENLALPVIESTVTEEHIVSTSDSHLEFDSNIPEPIIESGIPEPADVDMPQTDSASEIPKPVGACELPEPVDASDTPEPVSVSDIPAPESFPDIPKSSTVLSESTEDLPPPPPEDETSESDQNETVADSKGDCIIVDNARLNHIEKVAVNGGEESSVSLTEETAELAAPACNGRTDPDLTECLPQEPVQEKLADLITEVPSIPDLKTEVLQETSSDVVLAN